MLRLSAGLNLYFCNLQIPIAILVPNKLVNCCGNVVEAIVRKTFGDLVFGLLQQRRYPTVCLAKRHIAVCRATRLALCFGVFFQAAILSFAIHQHKAGGIPQFVAEVAIAFAALTVEVNASAERRQGCKGEAQGISTVGRNAVWKFFLRVLFDLGCSFRFA